MGTGINENDLPVQRRNFKPSQFLFLKKTIQDTYLDDVAFVAIKLLKYMVEKYDDNFKLLDMNFNIVDKDDSGEYHPHEFDRHHFEVWLQWDMTDGSVDAKDVDKHFAAIYFIKNNCSKHYNFVTKYLANSDYAWSFLCGRVEETELLKTRVSERSD